VRQRNRRNKSRLWLAAAGVCVPVAAAAVLLTQAGAHPGRPLGAKPVSYAGGMPMGGWGRGGYPMTGGAAGHQALGQAGTSNSADAAATSTNWAGYAAAGQAGTFTSVSSSWTQPAVTCGAQQTFSSFWVGLDGDGTQSVEQTGTEADCDGATAAYSGWFEMFPNAPVFYDKPVRPGDDMVASVTAEGAGVFMLTLFDMTQNWSEITEQNSNVATLASAEVIAEAPTSDGQIEPLSNFGTVNFAAAAMNNAAIGSSPIDAITMLSGAGVTEATPSAISGGVGNFSVTWDSRGA
jgi:hypothetical protein